MERIVVGVDAEAPSDTALDWVIRRAAERAVDVRLVTAIDMLLTDPTVDATRLETLRRRVVRAAPGAHVTTTVVDGSIVETLVEQSRTADLLVLGYHRARPLLSMLSGALPARVSARAHCSTVIVPGDWRPRRGPIVVGVGDDDSAATAIEFAAREADQPRRELRVVHAWQLPIPTQEGIASLAASADELLAAHRTILDEAVATVRAAHPELHVQAELSEAPASRAILDRATRAELVVLGTHRRGPASGMLLGSTLLGVLPECQAPVAIVPLVAPLIEVGGQLVPAPHPGEVVRTQERRVTAAGADRPRRGAR